MTQCEKKEFTVGRTTTTPTGICIVGGQYNPAHTPQGLILFAASWNAHWEDFDPLLRPLADRYRIIAVNFRGHRGSGGVFEAKTAIEDLIEIGQQLKRAYPEERQAYMGHSLSSLIVASAQHNNAQGVVLLNPYVNVQYLPPAHRIGVNACSRDLESRALLDTTLAALPLKRCGFNTTTPLATIGALKDFDFRQLPQTHIPTLYFITNKDVALGTSDSQRQEAYHNAVQKICSNAQNASALVQNLNHCYNRQGFAPFLKPEKGKNTVAIITHIDAFLAQHLASRQ